MTLFANILIGAAAVFSNVLFLLKILVVIGAVLTWVNPDPYNPIVRFINGVTMPMYAFVRRYIKTTFGALDLAPIIVLLVILFAEFAVVSTLYDYGQYFRLLAQKS